MYEIRCTLTGDTAEAEDLEGALTAAAAIVRDAVDARPFQGRAAKARGSLLVTRLADGGRYVYDGPATLLARSGQRKPLSEAWSQ